MQKIEAIKKLATGLSLCVLATSLYAANSVSNTVTHASYATVTEALAALSEDGQTLIVAPGVYTESELVITYAVTLRGMDAATTVIQPSATPGSASTRVASVNIPAEWNVTLPVVFEQLTLRHGNTSGNGGALYVQEGSLQVLNCIVSNNAAGSGGGLFCMSGADASLTVEDTLIKGNTATSQGGGGVRGAFLRCTFGNNRAANGGGAAYASLDGCDIENNAAADQGGGLYQGSATRCTIRNNVACFGGGAFGSALANALLSKNSASQNGGGLYQGAATNCTLVVNAASTAGGGLWGSTAVNSILYGNQAPAGADYTNAAALAYCCASPLPPGIGNTNTYPRFRDIDSGDYSLLSYSPCVNAGNSAATPPGTDLSGNARTQSARVDMGAYEHDPAVVDYLGFEQWLQRHGIAIDPANQFTQDQDGDGIPNGLAFAFGANRIDGAFLSIRHTPEGAVAETAPQQPESIGYVDLNVETTDLMSDAAVWTNAQPVATGAPPNAYRFRCNAPNASKQGFFRLKAKLP